MSNSTMRTNVGAKGKAKAHFQYVLALGKYAHKLNEIEFSESGNMPSFAKDNPAELWECADLFERKNGSTYREHQISLPRNLDKESRLKLVKEWIETEIGDKPFSYAIHNKIASDGGEHPHLHLMFCERLQDGIERTPQQFFKRYNAKDPSKGGCQKDNTGKTPQQRELEIKEQRHRWQEMANRYLVAAGLEPTVDVRNWQERGLSEPPPRNKPMWQWQAEKRAESLLEQLEPKPAPIQPQPEQPKIEPKRNDRYDSPSPF